jgi:hypothetical protein
MIQDVQKGGAVAPSRLGTRGLGRAGQRELKYALMCITRQLTGHRAARALLKLQKLHQAYLDQPCVSWSDTSDVDIHADARQCNQSTIVTPSGMMQNMQAQHGALCYGQASLPHDSSVSCLRRKSRVVKALMVTWII